jgi:hypothetical protein
MTKIIREKRGWVIGVVSGALVASLVSGLALGVLPSTADDGATADPPRDVFIERVEGPGGEPGGPGDVDPAERPRRFGPGEEGARVRFHRQLTPGQRERVHAAIRRFAACMREQGIDLPTPPEPGERGKSRGHGKPAFFFRRHGRPGQRPSQAEWRKLRAAHEKCEQHLPEPPR